MDHQMTIDECIALAEAERPRQVCTSTEHDEPSCRSADPHQTAMAVWCEPCRTDAE